MNRNIFKKYKSISKILTLVLIFSLAYGAFNLIKIFKLRNERMTVIRENQEKIEQLEADIESIKLEIEGSGTPEFVEKIARDELGMVKPREIIVVDKNKKNTNNPQRNN